MWLQIFYNLFCILHNSVYQNTYLKKCIDHNIEAGSWKRHESNCVCARMAPVWGWSLMVGYEDPLLAPSRYCFLSMILLRVQVIFVSTLWLTWNLEAWHILWVTELLPGEIISDWNDGTRLSFNWTGIKAYT